MPQPRKQADVKVVSVAGHIRMGEGVDRMRSDIDAHLKAGQKHLVINMAGVKSLDSSGIGVLVRSLSLAKQSGGTIRLASVPENAKNSLQLTGILRLFDVYADESQAVAAFSR